MSAAFLLHSTLLNDLFVVGELDLDLMRGHEFELTQLLSAVQVAYAFAFVDLLAFAAPAADATSLKQDSSSITDADILNFALNLECL